MSPFDRSIYLASRSPRRRELLAQIGVRFQLLMFREGPSADADLDEAPLEGEPARDYVMRVARAKAAAGWQRIVQRNLPRAPVLAADTTVALDGAIFGKPADRRDAERMLAALAGRRHEVLTAVVVRLEEREESVLSASEVSFAPLSAEAIRRYVASGESDDKAGAYALQGRAAEFVAEVHGSPSGIAGLPLHETALLLGRLGTPRERRDPD